MKTHSPFPEPCTVTRPASCPTIVFCIPRTFENPALVPTYTFSVPVVFPAPAKPPKNVFIPVVFTSPELLPKKALLEEVFTLPEWWPIAVNPMQLFVDALTPVIVLNEPFVTFSPAPVPIKTLLVAVPLKPPFNFLPAADPTTVFAYPTESGLKELPADQPAK